HPTFDKLFAFGIDPVDGGLPSDTASDWPKRDEINSYNLKLREELDRAIERALANVSEGHPQLYPMLETAIEHRLMHAQTLAYLLHQPPSDRQVAPGMQPVWTTTAAKSHLVDIPAGRATLGLRRIDKDEFGWDNEKEAHDVFVPGFAIDNYNVTNRDFQLFYQ